jgi:simple sugar transport system substrate-binding protein
MGARTRKQLFLSLSLLALMLALLLLAACQAAPPPLPDASANDVTTQVQAQDQLKIQFIGVFINEAFFDPVKKGMADAADMMGVDAEFIGDEGGDWEHQNELIRKAVDDGVDGIAVDIIHPTAYNESIQYAMDHGVPVVAFNVDATNGAGPHLAYTQQDFVLAGEKLVAQLKDRVEPGSTILVTKHDEGISALDDRAQGIKNALGEIGVTIVETTTTADPAVAKEKITAALEEHPEIAGIFATGQADTEGAGLVAEAQGDESNIKVVGGFDISDEILRLIGDGYIQATTDQQPYVQGFYPVIQLVLNIRYGLVPDNVDAGAGMITPDNVADVIQLSKEGYR